MVKALHAAGLEVILDVVYNHTGEGAQDGPTLELRGLDNAAYYRLPDGGRLYVDYTGCGNTLDVSEPRVLQMVMDSLRYWVAGDARRRVPVRPRGGARPVDARRRHAGRVPRPRSSRTRCCRGSSSSPSRGTSARAATRSASSRRCGASGTTGTETRCATSGGAPRAASGTWLPAVGVVRPVPDDGAAPLRVGQLRDRARRLHAARPGEPTTQAQRGQRREQPRRHRRQPHLEPRRRGRDRRRRGAGPRRRRTAQPARHPAAGDRRADAHAPATSWGARRAATTTPTAWTTRRRGSTGSSRRWQQDLLAWTRTLLRAAPRATPCSGSAASSRGGRPIPAGPRTWRGSGPTAPS